MKALLFLVTLIGFLSASAREKKLVHHANGKVQYEYEMEGFMFDGRFSCYYESGKLKVKGQFSRNKKAGLWRVWDEKGILRSERIYTSNLEFSILNETDSAGNRIRVAGEQVSAAQKGSGNALFMHRFLHSIAKTSVETDDLFSAEGILPAMISMMQSGNLSAFTDDRLVNQVNIPSISCVEPKDVIELLIKEEYSCIEDEGPAMVNRLLAICLVIMEKGKAKELGWIYVPDLETFEAFKPTLQKIRDRQFESRIIKTTINDPSFKLREVAANEHDLLRLMLVEFEAGAIIYVMDQQTLASN
ncbi:MAG: hypothetical protein ACXWV0_04505 [Flavisolibacter sp.]